MGSGASSASRPESKESGKSRPGTSMSTREPGTYYIDPFTGDMYIFKDPDEPDDKGPEEEEDSDQDEEDLPTLPLPKPPKTMREDIFSEKSYKKIDDMARNLPMEMASKDYDTLVEALTKNCGNDDVGKVRSLFTWLTSQDVYNMNPTELPPRNSPLDHILQIRFGTNARATHSYIFYQLCNAAEIPSVFIRGVNKSAAYEVGESIDKQTMTSSWNAVYINNDWRLVDAFWASTCLVGKKSNDWTLLEMDGGTKGDMNGDDEDDEEGHAAHYMNEFFFLADPDKFSYTHIPDEPIWQLRETPFTMEEFETSVYVRERFHLMAVRFNDQSTQRCLVDVPEGEYVLEFELVKQRSKKQVFQYFLFKSGRENVDLDRFVMYEKRDSLLKYTIRFPVTGKYKIQVFGNEAGLFNEDDTQLVCTYVFNVKKTKKVQPLPDNPEIGWGPGAEADNAGLTAVTHKEGLIVSQDGLVEIRLKSKKDLDMLQNVLAEGYTDDDLRRYVVTRKEGDEYVISLRLPNAGEYALKLNSGDGKEDGVMENVCNYLVKVMKGDEKVKPFPLIQDGMLGTRPGAKKHGVEPIPDSNGLVRTEDGKYQLRLKKGKDSNLMCELTHNTLDQAALEKCVTRTVEGDEVVFDIDLPKADEFGVNVYATKKGSKVADNVHNCLLVSSQPDTKDDVLAADGGVKVQKGQVRVNDGKAVIKVPKIPGNSVATVEKMLKGQKGFKVKHETVGDEDVFTVDLPEVGKYDINLYSEENGIMTKHWEFEVERTNEVLRQPTPPPEKEMTEEEKARDEQKEEEEREMEALIARMKVAMEAEDADALEAAIKEYRAKGFDDPKGRVKKAEEFLAYLRMRDRITAAMTEKNLDKLDSSIDAAEADPAVAKRLGIQLAMAKRMRDQLRRLAKLRHAILNLDQKTIAEIKSYSTPPSEVYSVMKATFILLGNKPKEMKDWNQLKILIGKTGRESLKRRVGEFEVDHLEIPVSGKAKKQLSFDIDTVRDVSAGAATFFVWCAGMIEECESR